MSERYAIAFYDGRTYLGEIAEVLPARFEAVLPSGKSIGLFSSISAAVHALFAAAQPRTKRRG